MDPIFFTISYFYFILFFVLLGRYYGWQQGYAVIDLEILHPSKIEDICLSKFIALVLQVSNFEHGDFLKKLVFFTKKLF